MEPNQLREMANRRSGVMPYRGRNFNGTHWGGCEEHHWDCALLKAADMIDALNEAILEFAAGAMKKDPAVKALVDAAKAALPVLELAMDISLKHEPCGYYCDEAVGHVDHKLFNWAREALGELRDALAALEGRNNHDLR